MVLDIKHQCPIDAIFYRDVNNMSTIIKGYNTGYGCIVHDFDLVRGINPFNIIYRQIYTDESHQRSLESKVDW